jgi:hypothetical protein
MQRAAAQVSKNRHAKLPTWATTTKAIFSYHQAHQTSIHLPLHRTMCQNWISTRESAKHSLRSTKHLAAESQWPKFSKRVENNGMISRIFSGASRYREEITHAISTSLQNHKPLVFLGVHPWCSLVFPSCFLVWEAIFVVFPHVQKKMCWEKIICHKGISTRIFKM